MQLFESTRKFWEEANRIKGYPLTEKIHGYFYLRFPFFYIATATASNRFGKFGARLVAWVSKVFPPHAAKSGEIAFADTYHGKVIPLQTARQLVSVKENIRVDDLEKVIPYQLARSLILDHPESLVALDCPCRVARENPCLPLDVCLIVGEPFASFTLDHHPQRSRAISNEEALAILDAEEARGHVHHAFFKEAVLQRFYAICNCCSCCCGAMLASSGYIAQVDDTKCIGCGMCEPFCQFHAIVIKDGFNHVDTNVCMGCGICVSHCDQNALELVLSPAKPLPLEMDKIFSKG